MSALAVVYDPSGRPVDPGVLERVMARLSRRGPDGSAVLLAGHAALGHWHFWTTPEETGEHQPLKLGDFPFTIVFDGRLDNRSELLDSLKIPLQQTLSDAALALQAYAQWGEHCCEHFIGEYALVILDEHRGELLCARDALGDRTLFYAWHDTRLVVASEPWAVAGADGESPQLQEDAAAHYFALRPAGDGQTLFKGVYELLPAQVLCVSASGRRTWQSWQPDPSRKVRYKTDAEYAEHFRGLLESSVRRRMRAAAPAGILLSGGLDSTSVACLAARMLAPQPLTTLSYVFDELTDCDERQYIAAVSEKWGIRSIQIPCDDAWPYRDYQNWPRNPNQPEGNPYRLLKERVYSRARAEGLRVLLTGGFGDHLYGSGVNWLADLLADGHFLAAGRELGLYLRYAGLAGTWQSGCLQRLARALLDAIPGGRHLHRRPAAPPWLTDFSVGALSGAATGGEQPAFERYANLLGPAAAISSSREAFNASRYGLELRHPYRDRDLVEFVLALPAYQLRHHGMNKYILRTAMQGILPEMIRTRRQPTSLISLFVRGVKNEEQALQASMCDPGAAWRKFVRAEWLSGWWNTALTPETDGPQALVPWLCNAYAAWHKESFFSN